MKNFLREVFIVLCASVVVLVTFFGMQLTAGTKTAFFTELSGTNMILLVALLLVMIASLSYGISDRLKTYGCL